MNVIHPTVRKSGAALAAALLCAGALAPRYVTDTVHAAPTAAPTAPPRATSAAAATRALAELATMPLHFEPRGTGDVTTYVARGQGYNVSIGATGAAVALVAADGRHADVRFVVDGAASDARLAGADVLPGVVHRYVGTQRQTGGQTFGRVRAEQVRPGIDVVYYGNQRQLEYDFVVAPGADPDDAGMRIEGADRLEVDAATGDLLVHVAGSVLRQRAPVAYQTIDGTRVPVSSAFTLDTAQQRVGFAVGAYDTARPLVIDPVLVYSTWFGGQSEEAILAMKVDAAGYIYVLGVSADRAGFPVTPGALQPDRSGTPTSGGLYPIDYFVSKFNPAGTALVYSTLFGGTKDEATWSYTPGALAIDAQGRVHFVGDTLSPDYPVTPDAADGSYASDPQHGVAADAVYTRLNADGSLSYSTYIGGSRREAAVGVDIDQAGNVYVLGKTASAPADGFVTTPGAYRTTRAGTDDIFVQRYAPSGALVYSTYFGGTQGDMSNKGDIVANGDGKVTFGSDTSTDIAIVNGFQTTRLGGTDGFVAQIDTDLAGAAGLLYSSYITGNSEEHVYALDIDQNGYVYVGGESRSYQNFPVISANAARAANTPVGFGQEPWDGFVLKLDLTQTGAASRVWGTWTGGNNFDDLQDLAVDPQGRVHLVGTTRSADLPQIGALAGFQLWQMPPYVQILNSTGTAFVFSSYIGSNTNGQALYTIATNAAGETYLGGATNAGSFWTPQFPDRFRRVNPFQTTYGGGDLDAVIQKLGVEVDLSITKTANGQIYLPGQDVTFTLQVTNLSNDQATGVVVSDTLPAGLQYVSCTPGAGGVCGGTGNARTITFATLAPGASASMTIVAKMTSTVAGQQITNTATVAASVLDPVPANNTATATVAVPTLEPTGDADGDGLPNDFESRYGLDPFGNGPGTGPADDPDGDGRTNLQELQDGTHPRGFVITYLAEGATGSFFDTRLAIANPGATPALVLTRFQKADGTTIRDYRVVAPMSRATIDVKNVPGLENAEFSTLVEADERIVADRTMTWDQSGYGSHAERGILTRTATTWYFAEGATFGNFDLFYLIQNPNFAAADVKVTFLLPTGAPLTKTYTVKPQSRLTIWVDEEGRTTPGLEAIAENALSAIVESTNGVAIIAERAMYLNQPGRMFGAGHESAGVTAPSTQWFMAEGATGSYFDLFILIANPQATPATVQAEYLLGSGQVITKTYQVAGNSRFNIWVDLEDAALANAAVSTRITSTNGVPIIAERAMWWPGTPETWHEAHNSPGETTTGTKWAMAEGELGGPRNVETYVLVANTSAVAGTIRATVLFADGTAPVSRDFNLNPNSRFNVVPYDHFPETRGKTFGMIVESLGAAPIEIVVERAMYSDANGLGWAAGSNALATKIQ